MFVSSVVCFVGSGICDGLIAVSEEIYRVCVSNCVGHRNLNTRWPAPDPACSAAKRQNVSLRSGSCEVRQFVQSRISSTI